MIERIQGHLFLECEAILEEKLIKHLELLGYTKINLRNLDDVKEKFFRRN